MKKKLGKSATEITVEFVIDKPLEDVWKNFSDVAGIYLNSPTVDSSYYASDTKRGVGAIRHMLMAKSIGKNAVVEEQVIEWKDKSFISLDAILIENISGLKTMGGDFYFSENGNKTIVKATLKYSMTNGFFGMMNGMMGRKKFTKTWKSIMAGYKLHTETGVKVTEKTVLPVEEVKLLEVKKNLNK